MANLPADAVAVVVLGRDAANGDAAAILEEDAAAVVAVEVGVLGAIAVEGQSFDGEGGDVLGGGEGEDGGRRRVAHLPIVFAQGAIELEAIAGAGDQGAFENILR